MTPRFLLTPYFLDEYRYGYHMMRRQGWTINETTLHDAEDTQHRVLPLYRNIAYFVSKSIKHGELPVSVAGDCCSAVAVLAGLQGAGVAPHLIWFDAHGDFNTWETTPSGFLGGMPLAMMVGRGEQTWMNKLGLTLLPETDVTLTDARDLDPEEAQMVADSDITHLDKVDKLLDDELPQRPIWVHFDADVMRPEDAPAMSYLAHGGPSKETLRAVFERIGRSGRLTVVSVSAWNPLMDRDGKSKESVLEMMDALIAAATT